MIYKTKPNKLFYFAHRGAPNLFNENTTQSIAESIKQGSDGVEIDIQRTKDNKIILFHDDHITTKNNMYSVDELTYLEISRIQKRNKKPPPSQLNDLMSIIIQNPSIVFNIEIKSTRFNNYRILQKLFQTIPTSILHKQCIISSFNYFILFQLKYFFDKNTPLAIILDNEAIQFKNQLLKHKLIIKLLSPAFFHPEHDHLEKTHIKWAHKNHMYVNTFTINYKEQVDKLLRIKVDGIFTDNHNLYNN